MTNHKPKHPSADMAGLDGLIERLRADLPEVLCEKHWMVDFDAVEAQRAEAATQLQALADRIEAQAAEIEKLREALGDLIEAVQRRTADLGGYDGRFGLNKSIVKARAALEKKQ